MHCFSSRAVSCNLTAFCCFQASVPEKEKAYTVSHNERCAIELTLSNGWVVIEPQHRKEVRQRDKVDRQTDREFGVLILYFSQNYSIWSVALVRLLNPMYFTFSLRKGFLKTSQHSALDGTWNEVCMIHEQSYQL